MTHNEAILGSEAFEAAEMYLRERQTWIADVIGQLAGDRTLDPVIVLSEKTMNKEGTVRNDTAGLELDTDQEQALREKAGRFGIGGHQDVLSWAEHAANEGGKPWKVEAELAISMSATTKSITLFGWPERSLGQDEVTYLNKKFGKAATNEYDMVRHLAEAQAGFVADEIDEVLPFGYDIHNGHQLVEEPTGQLKKIGTINGIPVLLARIDCDWVEVRDDKTEALKRVPQNRPNSAAMMLFLSSVLAACGDETSTIGFNTSNTYASRAIDTIRAGLKSGRSFRVGMYGRQTLRKTGAPVPAETPINQLPSELRIIHDKLQALEMELGLTPESANQT